MQKGACPTPLRDSSLTPRRLILHLQYLTVGQWVWEILPGEIYVGAKVLDGYFTGHKYLGSLYEEVNKAQLVSHCQLWSCSTLPAAESFCWGTCQHAGLSCCEPFCDADSNMQPAAKCPPLATVHPLSLRMLFLSPPLFIPSPLVFPLFCLKASVRAHHSALLSALSCPGDFCL